MTRAQANKYCRATDLTNEASVEAFFVNRLLADLGYHDNEIKTKRAIQELRIPRGRQSELYPSLPTYVRHGARKELE